MVADTRHAQISLLRKRIHQALIDAGIAERISERSTELTENSEVVLERRYLSKDRDGNIQEDADGLFRRVARNLSLADLNYTYHMLDQDSEDARYETEERFYNVMRRLEFMPNSPTLMNAGRELQQLSACFVLPVDDSLDSIFERVKQTALIHKSGGGTGFSFSRLRPEGDSVGSTGGVASGPVSFINAFDAATDVVKQGGTRRGANMGILNVDHPDIMKFIHAKEDGKHLNNFNISVAITEEFMERVKSNKDYDLVNPRTDAVTGQLNAREVFEAITQLAWQTGDPGIVFLDRMNGPDSNPNPQLGKIESTNPCGEANLLPFESCNLGSINLARMVRYTNVGVEMDWDKLQEVTHIGTHMLDNVIDMNNYPLPEIAAMSKRTRRIGVGVMGFADLLVQLGIQYDSEEALELAEKVMRFIQEETYNASEMLAERRGSFPEWEESVYWEDRVMRNSAPVTIAPTGTISIIAGASSGIEPLFALSYVRNVMDRTRLVEGNEYLEAVLRHEKLYSMEIMEQVAQHGTLQDVNLPEWIKNVFRTSHDIAPEWHVRMQAAFQKYTDNSVSKTINFPESATVDDVREAYMLAYETGCKGLTIYRDGSKDEQVLSPGQGVEQGADKVERRVVKGRPRRVRGTTERIHTGHGNMYVTINSDETGAPFEVFSALGKAGGCDSAQLEALSRMISLVLRSDVDPIEVVEQLRGITCCPFYDEGRKVLSGPDAVAHVLKNHIDKDAKSNHLEVGKGTFHLSITDMQAINGNGRLYCPDCQQDLHASEGCMKCVSCGWSKCD